MFIMFNIDFGMLTDYISDNNNKKVQR